jgi:hypothetical protein
VTKTHDEVAEREGLPFASLHCRTRGAASASRNSAVEPEGFSSLVRVSVGL